MGSAMRTTPFRGVLAIILMATAATSACAKDRRDMNDDHKSPGVFAGLWRVQSGTASSCRLSLSLRSEGENFAVDLEGCSTSRALSRVHSWRPEGTGIALLNKQGDSLYRFSSLGPDRLTGAAGAPLDMERAPE